MRVSRREVALVPPNRSLTPERWRAGRGWLGTRRLTGPPAASRVPCRARPRTVHSPCVMSFNPHGSDIPTFPAEETEAQRQTCLRSTPTAKVWPAVHTGPGAGQELAEGCVRQARRSGVKSDRAPETSNTGTRANPVPDRPDCRGQHRPRGPASSEAGRQPSLVESQGRGVPAPLGWRPTRLTLPRRAPQKRQRGLKAALPLPKAASSAACLWAARNGKFCHEVTGAASTGSEGARRPRAGTPQTLATKDACASRPGRSTALQTRPSDSGECPHFLNVPWTGSWQDAWGPPAGRGDVIHSEPTRGAGGGDAVARHGAPSGRGAQVPALGAAERLSPWPGLVWGARLSPAAPRP